MRQLFQLSPAIGNPAEFGREPDRRQPARFKFYLYETVRGADIYYFYAKSLSDGMGHGGNSFAQPEIGERRSV